MISFANSYLTLLVGFSIVIHALMKDVHHKHIEDEECWHKVSGMHS